MEEKSLGHMTTCHHMKQTVSRTETRGPKPSLDR